MSWEYYNNSVVVAAASVEEVPNKPERQMQQGPGPTPLYHGLNITSTLNGESDCINWTTEANWFAMKRDFLDQIGPGDRDTMKYSNRAEHYNMLHSWWHMMGSEAEGKQWKQKKKCGNSICSFELDARYCRGNNAQRGMVPTLIFSELSYDISVVSILITAKTGEIKIIIHLATLVPG